MRVAVWTALYPETGRVAEESQLLLGELARSFDVVAVVRDELVALTEAPDGVQVVGVADYGPYGVDLDVYHLANDVRQNVHVHAQALRRAGVVVLHEPSLLGLYTRLAGGERTALLADQVELETGSRPEAFAPVSVEGRRHLDPLAALFSPRLAAASLCTIVDSHWALEELSRRSGGAELAMVPRAVPLPELSDGPPKERPEVLVLAYDAPPDRARLVVEALAATDGELRGARITVACSPAAPLAGLLAERAARSAAPPQFVHVIEAPPTLRAGGALSGELARADLVVSLEWPTYGGTSPLVAAALRGGCPVLVSDHPQYRELDPSVVHRVATDPEALALALEAVLARPGLLRSMAQARSRASALGERFAPAAVGRRHGEILEGLQPAGALRRRARAGAPDAGWPPAVNAIASWEATTGLTEAARRSVDALVEGGVRVAMEDFDYGAPRRDHRLSERLRGLPRGRPYEVEICYLNVNELHAMRRIHLRTPHHPRYVIASWFWELPELPRYLHPQIDRVDEIWAPSRFVAGVFASLTDKPVRVVPCVVEPERDGRLTRADFGLEASKLLYFFNFDANSTLARKNPLAVIDAFGRAFDARERDGVQLVMKTINLNRLPEAAALLRSALERVGGVVVEDDLEPGAMAALTAMCDVYVSLHRGEGFGLGMAEAMFFGKPVVGTGYSGNLDFMSAANSCLVSYEMTKVSIGELRFNPGTEAVYEPGQYWAEPNRDDAARWMRYLYEHPEARARIGAAGATRVRRELSRRVVGKRMREILEEIHPD